jgi:hypothetical protein
MGSEEGMDRCSPPDDEIENIRGALVRRVAAADRDANREIYDTLETE